MSTLPPEHWGSLDPHFTKIRRMLRIDPGWRYGPLRVHQVAKPVYDNLARSGSIVGLRYADIGAGTQHPFGTSTVLYLNGVSFAAPLDVQATDAPRAAEALYDLLVDCLVEPEKWHWSEISRQSFLANIHRFDLPALQSGNLSVGIQSVPLRHTVGDLIDLPFQPSSFDLMSSRAVFEHFLDYRVVLNSLFRLMSPGGRSYHQIDLSDHRHYMQSHQYNAWSFLTEPEDWSDGLCNRLRAGEFIREIENAGFQVEVIDEHRKPLPADLRPNLAGRFAAMADEELEITALYCQLTRPVMMVNPT